MNKKYKLLIFDMDGTILDTSKDLTLAVNYMRKYYELPKLSIQEVLKNLGYGIEYLVKNSLKDAANINVTSAKEVFREYYEIHSLDNTRPYKGIIKLIKKLKKRGFSLAINSNKPDNLVKELNDHLFKGLFDFAIGESPLYQKKPSPASNNFILNHFNLDKADALYIGDSEVDFETARKSKIDVMLVTWGFRTPNLLISLEPDYIIEKPNNFFKYIV
ncbi:MAG: HAD family hydrolase [Acholeplasmatales bacterium]|jgi:phosphoglycolate phosphatase|nr:HAD family hydrolase [Acholeplasmatales bacterium]